MKIPLRPFLWHTESCSGVPVRIVSMMTLTLAEAQLFRLLVSYFGQERVIPHMSVLAVCNGELTISDRASLGDSSSLEDHSSLGERASLDDLVTWAKRHTCLFTIVDSEDEPRLVVEFFSGFTQSIDVIEESHVRVLPALLGGRGIRYVTISPEEFADALDPHSEQDLCDLLNSKLFPEESRDV